MTNKLNFLKQVLFVSVFLIVTNLSVADSGYELWMNYKPVKEDTLKSHYAAYCSEIVLSKNKYSDAIKNELDRSLKFMLSQKANYTGKISRSGIEIKTGAGYGISKQELEDLTGEGYKIRQVEDKGRKWIVIMSSSDEGLLYGTFHLIRLMQCGQKLDGIDISESPKIKNRMLNHWDNLDGYIERGYGGGSLWNWSELPEKISDRYIDYARANASIGINGTVIHNVNADPRVLRKDYLEKVAALANVFRKYNIKMYLSVNFGAPLKPSATPDVFKRWGGVGNLDTADPLDPAVIDWWKRKVDEIYSLIPDFGGFLVKANCEGMPGPQTYGRTHVDGANMLAKALKPHNGIVMWRTFVYDDFLSADPDRAKRPYKEFVPLDNLFDENVVLQVKNGPLDFQPREPVLPLFGAMKRTSVVPELQITQEYLGHSNFLVYLFPMWKDFFDFDTYCKGPGSTVGKLTEGKLYPYRYSAIAGVANTGGDTNWTGHHFAQANWYAFGRLAWNHTLEIDPVTEEWIKMTWNCDARTMNVIKKIMYPTWESCVASTTPYAIGMTCDRAHYGPAFQQRSNNSYDGWTVNETGLGTNRTTSGTDFVSQYFPPNRDMYNNINTCPEKVLLYFHFVPWNHKMRSGKTFQEELFEGLYKGMDQVQRNTLLWTALRGSVDRQRHEEVMKRLKIEKIDAEVYYNDAYTFFSKYTGAKSNEP